MYPCRLKKQKVGVPLTIRIECEESQFKFDLDLVPAIRLTLDHLPYHQKHRIESYNLEFRCEVNTFLAISLAKVDSEKFELDFHDIERSVLDNQPGAKKVIRLLKHLRDVKGGHFFKLWSHLLKTVVLNEMKYSETCLQMKISKFCNINGEKYWMEKNLENAFIQSLHALRKGLDHGIPDFFFPEYDLMSRISKVIYQITA